VTIPFEESYHGLLRRHLGNQRIILPAVRAVISNGDGRILFVKRSDNGLWVMPAGS
jgi:8-oxo-dGTP pyrophosphatase MutT (NUDIX family)